MCALNYKDVEHWSNLLDEMADKIEVQSIEEIPDIPLGHCWTDPDGRTWEKVKVRYGAVGGRWCYHSPFGDIIADIIFNGNSPNFAGMLRVPFDGVTKEALMIRNYEKI